MSEKRWRVSVRLKLTEQPIVFEDVVNAYQKGAFYCLYRVGGVVQKYPISDIFDVREDYGVHHAEPDA
jgi:hypothetical protein